MHNKGQQVKAMLPKMLGELGAEYRNRLFKHIEGYKQVIDQTTQIAENADMRIPTLDELKKDFLIYVEDMEAPSGSSVNFRKA